MTTLISWVSYSDTGASPHLPRALYFASDSRISWGSKEKRWDVGRKVFSPLIEPHLFGFTGEVIFPSLILSQIVSAIDNKILFPPDANGEQRHNAIYELVRRSYGEMRNAPNQSFTIVHGFRDQCWPTTEFSAWQIDYLAKEKSWQNRSLEIPKCTAHLTTLGTGADAAKDHAYSWQTSDVGDVSRGIFSSLCDAINTGTDPLSGGVVQTAALYTEGCPRTLGLIKDGRFFVHGIELAKGEQLKNIEWVDELFQHLSPLTLRRTKRARRFARPPMRSA